MYDKKKTQNTLILYETIFTLRSVLSNFFLQKHKYINISYVNIDPPSKFKM